ncbi:MAG: hypothetical protein K0U68_10305 [Gammaproteobacteria bacterium]|nr:hypothetical protein [Gammaproteobacteria bacterium]
MKRSIQQSTTKGRRLITTSLLVVLIALGAVAVHKAYAGKPTISLNSPVSFPVDI